MSKIRVLSKVEEYEFLKKVCPKIDMILKFKAGNPEIQLDQKEWKELRNLVGCLLMLDAGLRVGELIRIRYPDLYFHGQPVKTIVVRKEIAKGGKEREVPVSDRLRSALLLYRPDPELLMIWPRTQKVITRSREGAGLTTRAVEKMTRWHGIASIGLPVNPHMLRHTFATKLMRITNIRTVQELLGHSNLNSTQIYTHPNSTDLSEAISDMNKPPAQEKERDERPKASNGFG